MLRISFLLEFNKFYRKINLVNERNKILVHICLDLDVSVLANYIFPCYTHKPTHSLSQTHVFSLSSYRAGALLSLDLDVSVLAAAALGFLILQVLLSPTEYRMTGWSISRVIYRGIYYAFWMSFPFWNFRKTNKPTPNPHTTCNMIHRKMVMIELVVLLNRNEKERQLELDACMLANALGRIG